MIISNAHSYEVGFGMEFGSMMDTSAFGTWLNIGPVLFGYKGSLTEDITQDRIQSNVSYGQNGYLNNKNYGEPVINSFNLNYDIVSLFSKENPLKLYAGFYSANIRHCPIYWTSEINYFYHCESWFDESKSGFDLRVHYDIYKDENSGVPITISINDDSILIGLGYKMKF